jgi:hypothetical protein
LCDKVKKNEMPGQIVNVGESRGVYKVLVGKPEGKRELGRHKHRWVNKIKMNLQEVGCGAWVGLYGLGKGQLDRSYE